MGNFIFGIDIGGTSVKLGIITENGDIYHNWEIPTNTQNNGDEIAGDIWDSIQANLEKYDIQMDSILGLGIGVPGFINVKTGFVYEAVNIGWENLDLVKQFKQWIDLPIYIGNDANVAALGENWKGSGNQADNVIAITLGTGVGGGIIANGSLLNGTNGMAGEIGHITIEPDGYLCNCGRQGCLETIVSATGMVRQANNLMKTNPKSNMAAFYHRKGNITAKDIFDLANKGDSLCDQIVHYTAEVLGLAIANISGIINPEKVLIGGGVSQAGDEFIGLIEKYFQKYSLPRISEICEVKMAKLGNNAGMIGAAYLVKERNFS